MRTLPCIHSYHTQCIDVWLQINKACPCCNRKIDDITPVLVDGAVVPPA